jgi:transposase
VVKSLRIEDAFLAHVKHDPRDKVPVSRTLMIALYNVMAERCPLYKMDEWALQRELIPAGLAASFNDDRVGRALDRLFTADRAAIITAIVLTALKVYDIDVSRIHNDSTSITLFGDYAAYPNTEAAKPKPGHSKDHRPDLKQVVFSLSVVGDGAIPFYFKVWDGNITDDSTHVSNWMALRTLVGHANFIYVADCKLCVKETMEFIKTQGGSFVTIMPETRLEVPRFKQWIQDNSPDWKDALSLPNTKRLDGAPREFWTLDSPFLSSEGYRIVWVKSLDKQREDEHRRAARIERTEKTLKPLSEKVHTNRDTLQRKVLLALQENGTSDYFDWQITHDVEETFKQCSPGRPSPTTEYRKIDKAVYRLSWCQKADRIQYEARYDGIFPIITNRQEPSAEILGYYKYQPYLEKRHEQLKSVYNVAPVFLQNPQRIEALLLLYFIGMLVTSLIERKVRAEMKSRGVESVPIYPEERDCKAPTADKIIALFSDVRLQHICKNGSRIQTVPDTLSKVQRLALGLVGMRPEAFFDPG